MMQDSGLEKIRTRPQRIQSDKCAVCQKVFFGLKKPWCKNCRKNWATVKDSPLDRHNFIFLLPEKEAIQWLYELTDPLSDAEHQEENEKLHRKLAQLKEQFMRVCTKNQQHIDCLEQELEARKKRAEEK
jgi:hypothetical protein